jgi:hypothetical protein
MIAAELHALAGACVCLRFRRHCQPPLVGEPPREILALMLQPFVVRIALALLGLPRALRVGVAATPDARGAVIHAHGVTRNPIEQCAIVRDDYSDAPKTLEACDQQLARFYIKMVRRFIEHEHRRLRAERRADLPSLALAWRQRRPSRE